MWRVHLWYMEKPLPCSVDNGSIQVLLNITIHLQVEVTAHRGKRQSYLLGTLCAWQLLTPSHPTHRCPPISPYPDTDFFNTSRLRWGRGLFSLSLQKTLTVLMHCPCKKWNCKAGRIPSPFHPLMREVVCRQMKLNCKLYWLQQQVPFGQTQRGLLNCQKDLPLPDT